MREVSFERADKADWNTRLNITIQNLSAFQIQLHKFSLINFCFIKSGKEYVNAVDFDILSQI